MSLNPRLRKNLHKGNFAAAEEAWLEQIEDDSSDLGFFIELSKALCSQNQEAMASTLTEMLDEQLKLEHSWPDRLTMLREMGHLCHTSRVLSVEVKDCLDKLYENKPSYGTLVVKVGLDKVIDNPTMLWKKVKQLETFLSFDVGSVVAMKGKGAGKVTEINTALGSFKVDFVTGGSVRVGFAAARKMLELLQEGHVLRMKVEQPELLLKLSKDDPSDLVRIVLSSFRKPMKATDIRNALAGIVNQSSWNSWWTRTRKSDKIVSLPGGRHEYTWAESEADAVGTLSDRFRKVSLPEKLDLWRAHADRDPELKESMAELLRRTVTIAMDKGDEAEAFLIASLLEDKDIGVGAMSTRSLILQSKNPASFLSSIADRSARSQGDELIIAFRSDATALIRNRIFREADPRLLDNLSEALAGRSEKDHTTMINQLLSQPHRSPGAFTWLAEKAAEDEHLRSRYASRLILEVIKALNDDSFSKEKKRLLALMESGSTIPRALGELNLSQARKVDDALGRLTTLDPYQVDPLKNALHMRFPELKKEDDNTLWATLEAIEAKRNELKEITEKEIPTNRKAIQEAREMGDLRENFEYKAARGRHEFLTARAESLARDLARAQTINFSLIDSSEVRVGTEVQLKGTEEERTYVILGPWNSDPSRGHLSHESELAQKIIGLKVGEGLEETDLMVQSIVVWTPN